MLNIHEFTSFIFSVAQKVTGNCYNKAIHIFNPLKHSAFTWQDVVIMTIICAKLMVKFVVPSHRPLILLQNTLRVWVQVQQDSIPVGRIPPACQLYVFLWPPLDVSTSGDGVGLRSDVWGREGVPQHVTCPRMNVMCIPHPEQNDRHLWKHYFPASSFAAGNNVQLQLLV